MSSLIPRSIVFFYASTLLMSVKAAAPVYYQPVGEKKVVRQEAEVIVYGGTSAGSIAAIQAARLGRKTLLISFNQHVGGLTSGGLTASDLGDSKTIGGLALEYYQRLGAKTEFSSTAAERLYRTMLAEAGVTVLLGQPLESVVSKNQRIVSATFETGLTVTGKMFVDATYEGDLMAAANVSYTVGREPRGTYNESLAGQWQDVSWKDVYQFCRLPISPYVVADDPMSGLLPEISPHKPGNAGEGDYRVQAYNFRMNLTNKENRIPFPKPRDYDPARYGLLARFLNFDPKVKWVLNYTTKPMTDGPVQLRNGDANNAGSFSTDLVGGSDRWPDGTFEPVTFSQMPPPRRGLPMPLHDLYQLREKIFQDHVTYQQGLLYFLANDEQVLAELRKRVRKFGLDPHEFKDTDHWPHQLYIREGRRMVSDYVMIQANCEKDRLAEDSIGLASYPMDSHFCQRVVVVENGKTTVRNEGGFGHPCKKGAYPVSYRAIVPKQSECENLLVPVSLSASHAAFGSIRMEPVFMILGQSAGSAAALAIEGKHAVQDVPYAKLKEVLEKQDQKL
jgi:hypothetical protein